jgi:hypothetical protein
VLNLSQGARHSLLVVITVCRLFPFPPPNDDTFERVRTNAKYVTFQGHIDVVKILLSAKADPNVRRINDGWTVRNMAF